MLFHLLFQSLSSVMVEITQYLIQNFESHSKQDDGKNRAGFQRIIHDSLLKESEGVTFEDKIPAIRKGICYDSAKDDVCGYLVDIP